MPLRACEDFPVNKQGKIYKTCQRHSKKRELLAFYEWDDFINEIAIKSEPAQIDIIDVEYTFDLDRLPVAFGSQLYVTEEGVPDQTELTDAINQLVQIIWENCGFRFRHKGINSTLYLSYAFTCSQDISLEEDSSPKKSVTKLGWIDLNATVGFELLHHWRIEPYC